MKIRIVALGYKLPSWTVAAVDDYLSRFPREFLPELVELKPGPRTEGKTVEQILAHEAVRIRASTKGFHVVALDERGQSWNTMQLAGKLSSWREQSPAVAFVLGSADGIDSGLKRDADTVLSLSALTLPHGLARVLLIEQLYRAVSVLLGHPYHRE